MAVQDEITSLFFDSYYQADGNGWGIPRQIEPDFRIFCTTICDFDETWSIRYF